MHRHFDRLRFALFSPIAVLATLIGLPITLHADQLRLIESNGNRVTVNARVVTSEQGVTVIELNTGEYRLIPNGAILDRKPTDDPVPMTAAELAAHLCKKFPDGLTRSMDLDGYAVVIVLGSPLTKSREPRVKAILTKAVKFLKNVDSVYSAYCRKTGLSAETSRLPLGMLVFETERDFEVYASESTGQGSLDTIRLSGFYSGLTNLLAIRLSECLTYEVPAHEAMHQQSYNRGTFQRLASIPRWFDEGLATGFETVGAKISGSPFKISTRYARQALDTDDISWEDMLKTDGIFMGNVLSGEAYGQAWGLHWLLLTRYRNGYSEYLKLLAAKRPLVRDSAEERTRDFVQAFGKSPTEIEREFVPLLNARYEKSRKIEIEPRQVPGTLIVNDGLADVEVHAERSPNFAGILRVSGRLRNTSPIRPMSFYVCVEADSGERGEWFLPEVQINQIVELQPLSARPSTRWTSQFIPSDSFTVRVHSTTPESAEALNWKQGRYPAVDEPGGRN